MAAGATTRLVPALAVALAFAAPAAAAAPMQPVDPRFQDQAVLEDLASPTAIRFAPPPDGRIFVAEKSGRIRVHESGSDQAPLVTADLAGEVHDFWDRGLLGMALDPAFAINGRLYVLYTRRRCGSGRTCRARRSASTASAAATSAAR